MGSAIRATAVVCAALFVLSCGSTTRPIVRGGIVVRAPVAVTARYASDPPPATEEVPALARVIAASPREGSTEPLVYDARMSRLAEWLLERYPDGRETPRREVVDFLAQSLGIVDPTPAVFLVGVDRNAGSFDASVTTFVAQQLARRPYNRFGVVTAERGAQRLALVVLTSRLVRIEPIARSGETSRPIVVRGELASGLTTPSIAVTSPSGAVRSIPAGEGPAFDVRVPAPEPGAYQIEIIGRGERGETVLANFPVYRGVEPPDHVVVAPTEGTETEPAAVERELLVLLNRTRRAARLPPLESMEALGTVARAHSRDMIEAGYMGHVSPTTGDAGDRLRGAGVHSGLVLENIGRAYSAREIHDGLMASPGHRANMMNPDVTHVGVGVASESEGGRIVFVATEVFIRVGRRIDLTRSPQVLLEGINQRRAALGRPAVRLDAALSERAAAGARAFFSDGDPAPTQEDVLGEVNDSLRRFALAYSRIGAVMAVVVEVEEAAALEPVLAEGPTVVGIGLAQGDRAQLGRVVAVV
ncbi:MAG: hypothetical protein IT379_02155, partial [Deltaproteobacteria bacterium]|nr:hypothetical protein [Deltaproteobacteria bacterium]